MKDFILWYFAENRHPQKNNFISVNPAFHSYECLMLTCAIPFQKQHLINLSCVASDTNFKIIWAISPRKRDFKKIELYHLKNGILNILCCNEILINWIYVALDTKFEIIWTLFFFFLIWIIYIYVHFKICVFHHSLNTNSIRTVDKL